VANGQITEGTAMIRAAAPEAGSDPRGPYWLAVADEAKTPPDRRGAAESYRKALSLDPRYLPATLRLAALLRKQGQAGEALAALKQAQQSGAPEEALDLAWAEALIVAKNPVEAEQVYRKALARTSQAGVARLGLAAALEAQGKLDEAEQELVRTAAEQAATPGVRERLADLYVKRGKREQALATLRAEIAEGKAAPSVRVDAARLALGLGQLDVAVKELEAVVLDHPDTPEALFLLGRVREAGGERDKALIEYRRALAFEAPPALHLAYGRLLAQMERDEEALTHLDAAGALAPARLERGRLRMRRGELELALADFAEAAKLAPTDGEAIFLKGVCLDKQGKAGPAAEAWRAAVRLSPDLPEAHYRVGRFEMDQGRPGAAVAALRQAAAKAPPRAGWLADLYFQLGFAEAAAGSKASAVTALKRFLEVAPADAPTRPEVERQLRKLGR
jgi:tetratricopeptide (TPR) repeat protein